MDLWLLPTRHQIAALALAGFDALCARGDPLPAAEPGLDAALAAAFGWRQPVPWAALLADAPADSSTPWLAADLVHVRAEAVGARVMALAVDQSADPDLPGLFEALRPWLADEAIEMARIDGGRALLRCPVSHGDPATLAPDALLGCDLREALPVDLRWQRRLNEMQIVLAQQSRNESRGARGLPAWNTLWFWGQGSADLCPRPPLAAVASEDPQLRALARRWKLAVIQPGDQAQGVALRDLRKPRHLLQSWQTGLRPVDAELRFGDGHGLRLRPWHRWRFWRKAALLPG
jgi:hypothetical protein